MMRRASKIPAWLTLASIPLSNAFSVPVAPSVSASTRLDLLRAAVEARSDLPQLTRRVIDAVDCTRTGAEQQPIFRTELEVVLQGLGVPERQSILEGMKGWEAPEAYKGAAVSEALANDFAEVQKWLHTFRKVVALRQNRVLMPARAAQLYTALMSSCIAEDEDELAIQ